MQKPHGGLRLSCRQGAAHNDFNNALIARGGQLQAYGGL